MERAAFWKSRVLWLARLFSIAAFSMAIFWATGCSRFNVDAAEGEARVLLAFKDHGWTVEEKAAIGNGGESPSRVSVGSPPTWSFLTYGVTKGDVFARVVITSEKNRLKGIQIISTQANSVEIKSLREKLKKVGPVTGAAGSEGVFFERG